MNLSKHLTAVGSALLLVAMLVPTTASGAEPSPTSPDEWEKLVLRDQAAVEIVLSLDPRFAGISDWETLRRKEAATFIFQTPVESSYRVLRTDASDLASVANIAMRTPSSTIVEVMLVRDCIDDFQFESPRAEDPCGWRHTWYYRVAPDAVVTLLFDEGDPDEG